MPNQAALRERRLRKTKAQLVDEIDIPGNAHHRSARATSHDTAKLHR